jgi:hypothetical protein
MLGSSWDDRIALSSAKEARRVSRDVEKYKAFLKKLTSHPNLLAQNLQSLHIPGNPTRRLNRHWPRD